MTSGLRKTAAVTVDLVVLTVRQDQLAVLAVRRGVDAVQGPLGAARRLRRATTRTSSTPPPGSWRRRPGVVRRAGPPRAARHLRRPRPGSAGPGGEHRLPRPAAGPAHADGRDRRRRRPLATGRRPHRPTRGQLAFDHHRILSDGVERARAKLEYSPLAAAFCEEEFTIAELRRVYEAVWGTPLDPRNFHRKVTTTPGFVEPTGRTTTRDGGRPAQLFRRGTAGLLHPALLRPD